jgi:hypothetical protein
MNSRTDFGRRRGPLKPSSIKPSTPDANGSTLSDPMRNLIRIVPAIVILLVIAVLMAKLVSEPSGSSGFSGFACGSKPVGERGVFDIDWCHAAAAGLQGAARGFAAGAGARSAATGR